MRSCELNEQAEQAAHDLIDAICITAELMGTTLTPSAAALMAEELAGYPVPIVADALRACRREVTGRLTLAAILQRVYAADGRPGREEAWAIAAASLDEGDTVVMTDEIRQALSVAMPVIDARGNVAARMSFLEAYDRLVGEARRQSTPVHWSVSAGWDKQRRVLALQAAVRLKRLPADYVAHQIERLGLETLEATADGRAIAGLITGQTVAPSGSSRQKLAELRASVEAFGDAEERRKAQELAHRRQVHRERLAAHRDALHREKIARGIA